MKEVESKHESKKVGEEKASQPSLPRSPDLRCFCNQYRLIKLLLQGTKVTKFQNFRKKFQNKSNDPLIKRAK
jgi:hypothetical protein